MSLYLLQYLVGTSQLNLARLDIVIGIETWLNLTESYQPDIVIGIETRLNLTERF
jgi:hypothetical protein